MVARFFILLPFDLFITDHEDWPSVDGHGPDYRFKIYPPMLRAERPKPTESIHGYASSWTKTLSPPQFSENVLQSGRKIAQVNVLFVDFMKSEFNRSREPESACDPIPDLAFELANAILTRMRVYSRVPQIKALLLSRDPWELSYFTDELQLLEEEEGKLRVRMGSPVNIGTVALTPETMQMIATDWQRAEPYVWDELLLDAYALWPDVGSAIVIAYAALETFIEWALETLQEDLHRLPKKFWKWIKERDQWTKEPSVAEQFDALLCVFTGRSLKDEPTLWMLFSDLKKARNTLVHEGIAKVEGSPVDAAKAAVLIDSADKIIRWVELLLPENHRRRRTLAVGPFARRFVTPDEASNLGRPYLSSGQLGLLGPSGAPGVQFHFQGSKSEGQDGNQT